VRWQRKFLLLDTCLLLTVCRQPRVCIAGCMTGSFARAVIYSDHRSARNGGGW
jgi:hypothetical protein